MSLRTIAIALVALALAAPAALADPNPTSTPPRGTSVNPGQNPFGDWPTTDLRSPDARDPGVSHAKAPSDVTAAEAQEQYYSSYGEPDPIAPPAEADDVSTDDGIAPLPFVLALLVALTAGVAAGRSLHRLRRRGAPRPA
jgi:hypothetical protein